MMQARLTPGHALSGQSIDRSKPGQFRLNGRSVPFFAGDTVLSALLAAGIDCAGLREGQPIALTTRHAPAIAPVADRHAALPMERTPATDGADYVTLGHRLPRSLLTQVFRRDRSSLGLDLDQSEPMPRPWLGETATTRTETDLVVIGGGVAGMSAALAGAKRGLGVVLIEASPSLGGHARLFGTQDGEEVPDEAIARLSRAVTEGGRIVVLTHAEVFAIRPGLVRLHQVLLEDGRPMGRVQDIAAKHTVLATGSLERLPLFAGNRLPGVMGAVEAFALAHHHGVWPGKTVLFATSGSAAYRLAMLARDASIAVPRILDCRPQPQSRFIEFSKAYGITLASGTQVAAITQGKTGLSILPQLAMSNLPHEDEALSADRLITCGGFQPDLTLWHMAGGESAWSVEHARLDAGHGPAGIALIGSAAGWQTLSACMESGKEAVNALLDRPVSPIEDRLIDPIHETPDAGAPIGESKPEDAQPVYLDAGHGYLTRPQPEDSKWPAWVPFAPKPSNWSLTDTPRPLGIGEIAAGVQLGAIPAESAGIVAQERIAVIGLGVMDEATPEETNLPLPPAYLQARYPGAKLWLIAPQEQRALDAGSLIHSSGDESDPRNAIGVVVRAVDRGAIALVIGSKNDLVSLREPGHVTPIRLVARWREDMDLVAALG